MRKILICALFALALAAPSEAFSLKTPFVKAKHGVVYVGKKVAQGLAAFFFCVGSGQCE